MKLPQNFYNYELRLLPVLVAICVPTQEPLYKSVIFYNSENEKTIAEEKIKQIDDSGEHQGKVATELREAVKFYPAEEYHQDFIEKNGKVCYHQLYVQHKS